MKHLFASASIIALLAAAPAFAQGTTTPGTPPAPAEKTAPPMNSGDNKATPGQPGSGMESGATRTKPGSSMTQSGGDEKGDMKTGDAAKGDMKTGDANKAGNRASDTKAAGTTPSTRTASMEVRASKLMGSRIYTANNQSIGDINDFVIDDTGRIVQVIVGVGGFLGLGERNVAVPFEQLNFAKDKDNNVRISGQFTKQSLQSMPAWDDKNLK